MMRCMANHEAWHCAVSETRLHAAYSVPTGRPNMPLAEALVEEATT